MAGEKNFENKLKAWLKSEGCWHVKYFANRNTKRGIPDLLVCAKGEFVAIEVKGPGGKPSPLQLWTCDQISKAGGIAVVAWPEDFERLKVLVRKAMEGESVDDLLFEGKYLHPVP